MSELLSCEGLDAYPRTDAPTTAKSGPTPSIGKSRIATQQLLLQPVTHEDQPPHYKLTAREHQIMLQIAQGISLTDIGKSMFISVKTVSSGRARILKKLGVESNAELVKYAIRHKILHG